MESNFFNQKKLERIQKLESELASFKGRIIFIIIILPFVFGLSCLIGFKLLQIALNIAL